MGRPKRTLGQPSTSTAKVRVNTGVSAGPSNLGSSSLLQSTQPKQKKGASSSAVLTEPELDEMVISMVKVVLNLSVTKHPIKKQALVKHALAGNGRAFAKVIERATNELAHVYGYKLVETERNKKYIVVSTITSGSVLDLTEKYRRTYTLLYLILGYIFMKSGDIPEQGLWDYLAKLHITNDRKHAYFGDVRKLVTQTFIKQAYLVRTKKVVEGMNEDRIFIGWGVRAEHELSKKDILESMCKLLGRPSICYMAQHTAAYGPMRNEDDEDDVVEPTPK